FHLQNPAIVYICPYKKRNTPCDIGHTRADLVSLPTAVHIEKFLPILSQSDIQCLTCDNPDRLPLDQHGRRDPSIYQVDDKTPDYPADSMLTCNTCTREASSAYLPQCFLLCQFCSGSSIVHSGHSFGRFLDLPDVLKNRLTEEHVEHQSVRKPFHLSTFPFEAMKEFADTILRCTGCGFYYNKQNRHRAPVIIDCGHVCCATCGKRNIKGETLCNMEGYVRRHSKTIRSAIDIKIQHLPLLPIQSIHSVRVASEKTPY
ncbi:hypothetical protein PFISCL1PPCAC_5712, partial [Pristionchus fissidentatus]